MIQYDELKRLAEAATQGTWTHLKHGVIKGGPAVQFTNGSSQQQIVMTTGADWMKAGEQYANADFIAAANPAAVLALIAENEQLAKTADCWDRLSVYNKALSDSFRAERDQLKAENEALRDDIEQNQYDANAWRNSEESVWIEVFNSEGDDPFISAISGQITVEQLALIQAEILEYREDYFEKGSGLYVFRCSHCQAHYDNVGMTEAAHWETEFESYSPFPWEEEAAAMGNGEQS